MIFEIDIHEVSDRYSDTLVAYDNGVPIDQLPYYLKWKKYRDEGDVSFYKSKTDQDIKEVVSNFIRLYQSIRSNGFREDSKILGEIDNDGLMRLRGGHHRISILKHLGYKTVKIDFELHPEFAKFINILKQRYENSNRAYHPILHPVCKYWSIVRGQNRAEIIQSSIVETIHESSVQLNILDIGSFNGGISHYLALQGHSVTGIEPHPARIYCANYILNYLNKKQKTDLGCRFIEMDIISFFKSNSSTFDVVIMLSVDRWIEDKKELDFVFQTIGERCNQFYFESRGSHLTYALKRIKKLTVFTKSEIIGVDDGETKRSIYKFEI